jgi:hypothetical protein
VASCYLSMDAVMAQTQSANIDDIERMITNIEAQRNSALRELDRHGETLAQRLRQSIQQVEDTEFKVIQPPAIGHGKARVAQNARRQWLRVPVLSDPKLSAEVEALAREIAGEKPSPELQELARRVAAAQIDVIRVRRARHDTIADALGDPHFESRRAAKMKLKVVMKFAHHGYCTSMPDEIINLLNSSPQEETNLRRFSPTCHRVSPSWIATSVAPCRLANSPSGVLTIFGC